MKHTIVTIPFSRATRAYNLLGPRLSSGLGLAVRAQLLKRPWLVCALLLGLVYSLPLMGQDDEAPRPRDFLPLNQASLQTLAAYFSPSELAELAKEGALFNRWDDKPQSKLLPLPSRRQGLESELGGISPSLGNEVLFLFPLPPSLAPLSQQQQQLVLYNIAHRFSSMEGLEYYSKSRNAMRTFFTYSRFVSGPDNRKAIADPVFTSIPSSGTRWVQQQDLSFGNNLYRLMYRLPSASSVEVRMQNHEQIWYGIAPVLGPYAVDLHLIVGIQDNLVYFYGNVGINAVRILGLDERARGSYVNRMIALFSWFTTQVAKP